jgi:UDP-GlcNAc:undecaprenyl-phosphate GlcNAc-1-phosphate transferase
LFLGFILVSSGIYFLEKQSANANQNHLSLFLLLVAFFTIPVLDSIRVYLGRIKEGYSPFKADKSHLHHLLLQVGLPHKKIALFVTLWAIFLSFIGLSLTSFFSITSTILLIIAVFWTIIKVLLMINDLYKWRKMIQVMETY